MAISSSESVSLRTQLGLSVADIASQLGFTPHVVEAWESGKIRVPRKVAKELEWLVAFDVRKKALAESGLPECAWILAWQKEPVPEKLDAQTAHFERVLSHEKSCDVCQARQKFERDRFGEMPQRPMFGWMAVIGWIASLADKFPEWAQFAVWMGAGFSVYSLIRLVFLLPSIFANPRLIPGALGGIAVSVATGAGFGLLIGGFNAIRWPDRLKFPTARTTIAAWIGAVLIAGVSIELVPTWSSHWPDTLRIVAAGVLFVAPLASALAVTLRFFHRRQEQ